MTNDEVFERSDKADFLNFLIIESFNPVGSSFEDRQAICNKWIRLRRKKMEHFVKDLIEKRKDQST